MVSKTVFESDRRTKVRKIEPTTVEHRLTQTIFACSVCNFSSNLCGSTANGQDRFRRDFLRLSEKLWNTEKRDLFDRTMRSIVTLVARGERPREKPSARRTCRRNVKKTSRNGPIKKYVDAIILLPIMLFHIAPDVSESALTLPVRNIL